MEGKPRVLIVDDNVNMCKTLAPILRHKGYPVTIATSGSEAIERVRESPFEVVLLDIKMPVMNGVEAYRQIKRIRPETLAIMMTAYAVEDLVQELLEEGAYAIIHKPLDIERVLSLIQEAVETEQGALILVVDDDLGVRTTLKNILGRRGYQVGVASTGEEAIAMARENIHDIVLIDMKLPTISGLETYLAIKEINPRVVAIMVTAYRQEMAELVEEALHNSAYTCLYKPLDVEELIKLVDEIWERRKREARN